MAEFSKATVLTQCVLSGMENVPWPHWITLENMWMYVPFSTYSGDSCLKTCTLQSPGILFICSQATVEWVKSSPKLEKKDQTPNSGSAFSKNTPRTLWSPERVSSQWCLEFALPPRRAQGEHHHHLQRPPSCQLVLGWLSPDLSLGPALALHCGRGHLRTEGGRAAYRSHPCSDVEADVETRNSAGERGR